MRVLYRIWPDRKAAWIVAVERVLEIEHRQFEEEDLVWIPQLGQCLLVHRIPREKPAGTDIELRFEAPPRVVWYLSKRGWSFIATKPCAHCGHQ